ncbi:MAG: hypothetical protein AAF443_08715 [Chlamydiota bacterium]
MNPSLVFARIFFAVLSIFFMTIYMISRPTGTPLVNAIIGVSIGAVFMAFLIGFDRIFRKFNLRIFNVMVIGLFIGYLMGQGIVLVFDAILDLSSIPKFLTAQALEMIKLALFLFGTYLGSIMTLRASDQLYISIPFVKFAPTSEKKRDLIVDTSTLSDARLIDLCSTGLLDYHLIIPRFIIKELYAQAETGNESTKLGARQGLEVIKKMEELPQLGLRFNDTDFPEVKDLQSKLIRLARFLDANILIADPSQVRTSSTEGVQMINLHSLSNALKPLMEMGESINIKIQRYGKEPRQGVGYLEDGTMVVVNGGGNYIGETINAHVLSVKHTSSGRMIFCNVVEENFNHQGRNGRYKQGNQQIYYQQEEEHED